MNGCSVVQECAAQREAAAERQLTIADAVEHARWLRSAPDAIVDPAKQKRVIDVLLAALEVSPCYLKSVINSEKPFVLMPHDAAALKALGVWITIAEHHGCGQAKLQDAREMYAKWKAREDLRWPT